MKRWLVVLLLILGWFSFWLADQVLAQTVCTYENNPYRPGGTCKETVPYVDSNTGDYEPTCSSGPEVAISFESCGLPSGLGTCPNGQGQCMNTDTFTNMANAHLGGLGPDENAVAMPQDFLAQYYPFTALGGLPLDLTITQPKESFRTFWRLTTRYQQFNAKAQFFGRFIAGQASPPPVPPIFNSEIPYYPPGGLPTIPGEEEPSGEGEDKYGVNIGYGHIQASFCELSQGKPTVILVPVGETNISQYTSCYGGASKLVVRVTGLNPGQSAGELTAAGARIAQICAGKSNCVIEFGNELNNKEVEYACPGSAQSCGATYAAQFAAFKAGTGGVPTGPAALDIYNSVYPYTEFLAGAQSAYGSGDVAFANVYCLPEAGHCDPAGDIATIQAFNGGKSPFITEYGLGPRSTASMKEWVDWAKENIPSQEVTLLVPNLCPQTASGVWIHYKNGVVTDLNGQRIEPSTCGAGLSLEDLPVFTIQDLYNKLPDCLRSAPVCADALNAYNGLDEETKIQYDTLLPFSLDNVRGYAATRYLNADTRETSFQLLGENLPFVQPVREMLLQPGYGILQALSPDWINNARNSTLLGAAGFYTEPFGLTEPPAYPIVNDAAKNVWGQDKSVGLNGCRQFSQGTTKAAPLTYPRMLETTEGDFARKDFVQNLKVPVKVTQVFENGAPKICQTEIGGHLFETPSAYKVEYDPDNTLREEATPVQDNIGRSIVILNNPKMTDISLAVSETKNSKNYSLTYSFLPAFTRSPFQDTPILAKSADQTNNFDSSVEQKDIARKDGQAEIDLCEFRNFWLMPAGMQKGDASQCGDQNRLLTRTSAVETALEGEKTEAKQHLYEPTCNGIVCYEFIISNLAGGPRCGGKYLNPYVGIAIALNETGGLVSNLSNGANTKHFGCDPYSALGIRPYPADKFQCMVNTLTNDCNAGKSDADTLREYGYLPGNNLNSIIDILGGDEQCRDGYCFSLFVDSNTAQTAANSIRNILPGQKSLWAAYYSGYIREFRGE